MDLLRNNKLDLFIITKLYKSIKSGIAHIANEMSHPPVHPVSGFKL